MEAGTGLVYNTYMYIQVLVKHSLNMYHTMCIKITYHNV